MKTQILAIMEPIMQLFQAHGLTNIKDLPGAAEIRIDDKWYIAANGHATDLEVQAEGIMGATIPPFRFAIWYNGWLAGLIHPCEGSLMGVTEDEFTAAVKDHIARMKGE